MHRVALFTPLPPAQTGTADYAADLIPELAKLVDLRVFEQVPRNFKPEAYDAVVYQIGNNPFHAAIYELALEHPGVVVLHEVNLHHLIQGMRRGQLAYLREVNYEIFGQDLPFHPKDGWIEPALQPRGFQMMRRLLDRSRACIVHSAFAAEEVRLKGFKGRIARIPHGARVRSLDGFAFRARQNIRPEDPLVGMFGYQRPDKLACDCLLAFKEMLDHVPQAKLLVAGQAHPEVPLEERVRELGLQDRVRFCGFQDLQNLDGYIAACDVVLNLRSPTLGETSGIMMRAFGLGRTLVVSDNGANLDLPGEICARIPVDKFQNRVLAECLRWLLSDRSITDGIGRSAQEWVEATCSWEQVARSYARFLFPSAGGPVPADASEIPVEARFLRDYAGGWSPPHANPPRPHGHGSAEKHVSRMAQSFQMTPRGTERDRILAMGCSLEVIAALRELLGYGKVQACYLGSRRCEIREVSLRNGTRFECVLDLFDAEMETFPYPSGHFSAVLCSGLLENLRHDPMHMMNEIHRVLTPDGTLLLTTSAGGLRPAQPRPRYPQIPDRQGPGRHGQQRRHYTLAEVALLLSDAGFVLRRIEKDLEGSASSAAVPPHDRFIFGAGRKAALPKNRYPQWLYQEPPVADAVGHAKRRDVSRRASIVDTIPYIDHRNQNPAH